jgi:hypothetical protein
MEAIMTVGQKPEVWAFLGFCRSVFMPEHSTISSKIVIATLISSRSTGRVGGAGTNQPMVEKEANFYAGLL